MGTRLHRNLFIGGAVAAVAAVAGIAGVVSAEGRPLATDLSGAEEAPNVGDTGATGMAELTLNQGKGEVCFDLSWADIDGTVVAAHIHEAAPGTPGRSRSGCSWAPCSMGPIPPADVSRPTAT